MAAVDIRDNLLGISWVDSSWIPALNSGNVLDYFSERSNPFYDRTCNNEVVKMQRLTLEHLNQMVGVEYILLHAQEPILFIIRKQQRQSPTQVIPLADYYIIAGVIYQAPDLGSVINSRVLTAVHGIQSAFDEAMSYCRYHPSKGYWWHFKDHEEQDKVKPKTKRKEEPSSIFQRQRVDALLLDLRQKFPPKFVQQKSGEKPVPVDQTKKEAEPTPETVKSEEKETTKNIQQTVSTKGPPEKRMRLQTSPSEETNGECHVKTKNWSDASANLGTPRTAIKSPEEARSKQGKIPLSVSGTAWPCWHLDFGLPAFRTLRQYMSVVLTTGLWY